MPTPVSNDDPQQKENSIKRGEDVDAVYDQLPTTTATTDTYSAPGSTSAQSAGSIITEQVKRPEFASRGSRLKTLATWPIYHNRNKEDLSTAGFFDGHRDCTRCYYCNGSLEDWRSEDNVWVEHARWHSKCPYVHHHMELEYLAKGKKPFEVEAGESPYSLDIEGVENKDLGTPWRGD